MLNLVACPDCDKPVSRRAVSCPHCGAPSTSRGRVGCVGPGLLILGLLIAWMYMAADRRPAIAPYDVASRDRLPGGGYHGDVIAPSLSPFTPLADRELFARRVASRERLATLDLYSTAEARRANLSASYHAANPGALESGYLGRLAGDDFTPP